MKINNKQITIEDFEGLSQTLNGAIENIKEGLTENAIIMLQGLKDNIDYNLQAEYRKNQILEIGDKVKIVSCDNEYEGKVEKYVGIIAFVEIILNSHDEYIYNLKAEEHWRYPNLKDWLWKATDLELI